jgi:RNA polymerase sigma-70 factor (ECF subfamily)
MTYEGVPTEQLLVQAGQGDRAAVELLYSRYLPRLRRWAAGRLPSGARDLSDTHDLVQETLLQTFRHLKDFEIRGEGAFLAYLRRAILNRINNEIRRITRKPAPDQLTDHHRAPGPSPLEEVLGRDALNHYERSLQQLSEPDRHAIIARLEFGCSYAEVAAMLGQNNPAAARKSVERALRRLAASMGHGR